MTTSLYFIAHVYLGREIITERSHYEGAPKIVNVTDVSVNGQYDGVQVFENTNDGHKDIPRCFVAFRTTRNKAIAQITNDRFPHLKACTLAMGLAERIAPRVPAPR